MYPRRGVEAAFSRRRIPDDLRAQGMDDDRFRRRRTGDDARGHVLAATAEDQAHRARLFRRLRSSGNHPAGGFRYCRAGVDSCHAPPSRTMTAEYLRTIMPG